MNCGSQRKIMFAYYVRNVKYTPLYTYVANIFCVWWLLLFDRHNNSYLCGCVLCDTNHRRHEQILVYVQDTGWTTRTLMAPSKCSLAHTSVFWGYSQRFECGFTWKGIDCLTAARHWKHMYTLVIRANEKLEFSVPFQTAPWARRSVLRSPAHISFRRVESVNLISFRNFLRLGIVSFTFCILMILSLEFYRP